MADRGATVHIPGTVIDAVLAHAAADAPREACGLLIGAGSEVHRAVRARNVARGPARYRVAAEDHFAAIRAARSEGLDVVGGYHSHPATAAEPSATDRATAFADFVFVIATLVPHPHLRAWAFADGNFTERPLVRT
ncbi:MAG: M67 family metallopeptidase [Vicinamibacterales bacterium]